MVIDSAIKSSEPYLTGMGLRNRCHLIYDEFQQDPPEYIQNNGDVAFVKTDVIHHFFAKVVPLIKYKFKLITHNSSYPIDSNRAKYINNPKLIEWYAQNVNVTHPKLHSIPLSIMNARWDCGNVKTIEKIKNQSAQKKHLLYCNFNPSTNPTARNSVLNIFENQSFVFSPARKSFQEYLSDLKSSYFVLSPNGSGVDCHRLWETLIMGSIPIVENSINVSFYKHLPILIVDDWNKVNLNFLIQNISTIKPKIPEECYIDFWVKKIGLKQY
jgi:hypothetical protein